MCRTSPVQHRLAIFVCLLWFIGSHHLVFNWGLLGNPNVLVLSEIRRVMYWSCRWESQQAVDFNISFFFGPNRLTVFFPFSFFGSTSLRVSLTWVSSSSPLLRVVGLVVVEGAAALMISAPMFFSNVSKLPLPFCMCWKLLFIGKNVARSPNLVPQLLSFFINLIFLIF